MDVASKNNSNPGGEPGVRLLLGFEGTDADGGLKELIREYRPGGLVLFRRNIRDRAQLKALLDAADACARETLGRSLWVSIDQEGGPVRRLTPPHWPELPSAKELAGEGEEAVQRHAAETARELASLGIRIDLAPVLDVVSAQAPNFMDERSFGSDPQIVSRLGTACIRAYQDNGVSATAKHYPGLGLAELDPHHFAPVIRHPDEEALQRDLLPFRKAVRAGVHCVMTSHALYSFLDPELPATLSRRINSDMLRNELGFQGVLLSDDMDMAAMREQYGFREMVRLGLSATVDFFLLCQKPESIEPFYRALCDAVTDGSERAGLHEDSLRRIERLFSLHGEAVSLV